MAIVASRPSRLEAAVAELVAALRSEVQAERNDPASTPPALLSISEAARRLGVSRTKVYDEIGAGRIRTLHVGRRHLVPATALGEFTEVAS